MAQGGRAIWQAFQNAARAHSGIYPHLGAGTSEVADETSLDIH
jgi:hypothetical protein